MIVLINFYLSSHRFHCENINSYSCSQVPYYLNSIAHYREYCIICKCMYNITSKVTQHSNSKSTFRTKDFRCRTIG